MLGRLTRKGFTDVARMGVIQSGLHKGMTVVRAHHPLHGWIYEKIAEGDDDVTDAAVDEMVARANEPVINPRDLRIGAVKHDDAG